MNIVMRTTRASHHHRTLRNAVVAGGWLKRRQDGGFPCGRDGARPSPFHAPVHEVLCNPVAFGCLHTAARVFARRIEPKVYEYVFLKDYGIAFKFGI